MMNLKLLVLFITSMVHWNDANVENDNGTTNLVVANSCPGVPPAAVFIFDDTFKGLDVIHRRITAVLSGVDKAQGPYGDENGALMLRGTPASFIEIPFSDRLDIRHSITILAYIYPITGKLGPIVNYKPDGHGVQIWTNGVENGKGVIISRFNRRSLALTRVLKSAVLNLKEWNFIGASYNFQSGMATLWHDNKEVLRTSIGSYMELATQFAIRIGGLSVVGLSEYEGGIACLQFYYIVLTPEQIKVAKNACKPVAPVNDLSVHVLPSSRTVVINESITLTAFIQNNGKAADFTFDFGNGTKPSKSPGNSITHTYLQTGKYTILVTAIERCNHSVTREQRIQVTVTEVFEKLSGLSLRGKATSYGDATNFTISILQGNLFTCSFDFGDGSSHARLTFPSHRNLTITHQYNITANYTVQVVCSNMISNVTASVDVPVQHAVHNLLVNPIPILRHGSRYKIQWQTSGGSDVAYTVIIDSKIGLNTVKSKDKRSGYAWMSEDDYGSAGIHEAVVIAQNEVSGPFRVTQTFKVMYPVAYFTVGVRHSVEVNESVIISMNATRNTVKPRRITYRIYYGDGSPLITINRSAVTHAYSVPGIYIINVTAFNAISSYSVNVSTSVEEPVLPIEGVTLYSKPGGIPHENISLTLHINKGSNFECNLTFSDGFTIAKDFRKLYKYYGNVQTDIFYNISFQITRQFASAGSFEVKANCHNRLTEVVVKELVVIQDKPMSGFKLLPIEPQVYGNNISIRWIITQGTNVLFRVTFMSRNLTYTNQGSNYTAIITSDMYPDDGMYDVTIEGSNQVTQAVYQRQQVLIEKIITGITVNFSFEMNGEEHVGYGEDNMYFPFGNLINIKPHIRYMSSSVNYTYKMDDKREQSISGSLLQLISPSPGSHNIEIIAMNHFSRVKSIIVIFIQERARLAEQTLLCTSPVVINEVARIRFNIHSFGTNSCLTADVENGTRYIYGSKDCKTGNTSTQLLIGELSTKYVEIRHAYNTPGFHEVKVELSNMVSREIATCNIEVVGQHCKTPTVSMSQIGANHTHPRIFKRSETIEIKPQIEVFCPASRKTIFKWTLSKYNALIGGFEAFHLQLDSSADTPIGLPSLRIHRRLLPFGMYRVKLLVRMAEATLSGFSSVTVGYVRVVNSDLVAIISGGTFVRRAYGPNTNVNGSQSYDPDLGPANHTGMVFVFMCRKSSGKFPSISDANFTNIHMLMAANGNSSNDTCYGSDTFVIGMNGPILHLKTQNMTMKETYVISLVIQKGNRTSWTEQTIALVEGEPPSLEIKCIENCNQHRLNPAQRLSLSAECDGSTCLGQLSYTWNLYEGLGKVDGHKRWKNINNILTSASKTTYAAPFLIIQKNTFKSGKEYTIEVSAQRGDNPSGLASKVLNVNAPPTHGNCDVMPRVGYALMTLYKIRCFNWKDPDEPLGYKFMFVNDRGQQTILYYGENSEFAGELPLGNSSRNYTMDIEITVSDTLGAPTTVRHEVQSMPPQQDSNQLIEELSTMTSGNNSFLDSLTKSGKLQALSLAINTVSSFLNAQQQETLAKDTSGGTSKKIRKMRAEIRTRMIEKLNGIIQTTLESMNQVNNAMIQATKVTDEIQVVAQVSASNTLTKQAQFLHGHAADEASFDILETSAAGLYSALDNVLDASASSAAVKAVSGLVKATHALNESEDNERLQAQSVSRSLLGVASNIAKAVFKRKLKYEEPTVISTERLRISLKRTNIDEISGEYSGGAGRSFVVPKREGFLPEGSGSKTSVEQQIFSSNKNIYTWDQTSHYVTSSVIGLSYTVQDKPLKISGLKDPIRILIPRHQPLPKPQMYNINTTKSPWNFHKLSVTSKDDSFSIEVVPRNCSHSLELFILKRVFPSVDKYNWKKTIKIKMSGSTNTAQSSEDCSWRIGDSTMFLSNADLSVDVYFVGVKFVDNAYESTPVPNVDYFMRVYTSKCLYWDEEEQKWKGKGCWGGPMTNSTQIQCLSNHLTSFGAGMFVAPNPIDFSKVISGFKEAFETGNVVVLFFVLSLFALYALLAVWARRTDNNDLIQTGFILLSPPKPNYDYRYEITIVTGSRSNAGTTASVFCEVEGEVNSTGVYALLDPKHREFQRRSVKSFIISAPESLGPIRGIRIWHDCDGKNPSWFLRKVLMRDCQTDEKWYFLADCWLAVEIGRGQIEAFLKPITKEDLIAFSKLFGDKIRKEICDKHLWFSLAFRPQRSPFTRLQRLSCCLSLLCSTMVVSAMFYGVGAKEDTSGDLRIGPIRLNFRTIIIGIESVLIVLPINLFIVAFFRNSKAKESLEKSTQIDKKEDPQEKTFVNFKEEEAPCPKDRKNDCNTKLEQCEEGIDIGDVVFEFDDLNEIEENEYDNDTTKMDREAAVNIQIIKRSKKYALEEEEEAIISEEEDHKCEKDGKENGCGSCCSSCLERLSKLTSFKFPYWFIYVGWVLCFLTSVSSALFTVFYSMMWGRDKSTAWLTTMLIAFLQDTLISQPIKVLLIALIFALVIRKPAEEDDLNVRTVTTEYHEDATSYYGDPFGANTSQPLDRRRVQRMRKHRIRVKSIRKLLIDFCYYIFIVIIVSLLGYQYRSAHAYNISKTIDGIFTNPVWNLDGIGIGQLSSIKTVWQWTNETFIPGLFGGSVSDYHVGLKNSWMGVIEARLRQVRVKKGSCTKPTLDCNTFYSPSQEDETSYSSNWSNPLPADRLSGKNIPWEYRNAEQTHHIFQVSGVHSKYDGGGYSADLKNSGQARTTLEKLFTGSWIDKQTRALFAEVNVYNPNTNLVSAVTVVMEMPTYGGVLGTLNILTFELPISYSKKSSFSYIVEVIAFILLIVMSFRVCMAIFHEKCSFFWVISNMLDLAFVVTGLIVFILRVIVTNKQSTQLSLLQKSPDSFHDFHACGYLADITIDAFGVLSFLAVARFVAFLTFFSSIKNCLSTITKSLNALCNFTLVLLLIIIAYASLCVLAFGTKEENFKDFSSGTQSLYFFVVKFLSGQELPHPKSLSLLIFLSYSFAMLVLLLNVFRAILGNNHRKTRRKYKTMEEVDVVSLADLLLERFKQTAGIGNGGMQKLLDEADAEAESEQRLRIQEKYVQKSQTVMLKRYINSLYADEFSEDVYLMESITSLERDNEAFLLRHYSSHFQCSEV